MGWHLSVFFSCNVMDLDQYPLLSLRIAEKILVEAWPLPAAAPRSREISPSATSPPYSYS